MHEIPFLTDVVVLFASAVAVIVLSHRLRIPPVIGFLLTGILVGPYGLGLVESSENVEVFAELGVVFLLFVIGLELSVDRLRRLSRVLLVGGPLQAGLTIAVVMLIVLLAGQSTAQALYFGFVVALSSTAIVLKIYTDRRELEAPHGKLVMGILLFQDFLIVPLLLIVPVLAGTAGGSASAVALRFATGLAVLAVVFLVGRFVLGHLLHMVVRTRIRELLVIGSLFACLGAALITEQLGFSLALGAFLAGILIAESDYRFQVMAETSPFRDVFNSIFFISVGMLLDVVFVGQHLLTVLGLGLGITIVKLGVVIAVVRLMRYPPRPALLTGLALAQIGEFSFVLIRAGYANELLGMEAYQLAIATSVLTMGAAPLLIALGPRIRPRWGSESLAAQAREAAADAASRGGHVVLVGYGLNGRHLARVLRDANIPFCVIELNADIVREGLARGDSVVFGDATRQTILHEAGITRAGVAVFAVSDPTALRASVNLSRRMNPDLHIIARTRQLAEIEELQECGANEVIAEEFETSIEIVTTVLTRLHVPRNIIRTQAKLLRDDGYQALRTQTMTPEATDRLMEVLAAGTTDVFRLPGGHPLVGHSIRDSELRHKTGASIIAVVRGETSHANPPPEMVLEGGDTLVLVGNHAQIDEAFQLLGDD
jgi:CPA2 family monovalent cation:H+ antiporter-2